MPAWWKAWKSLATFPHFPPCLGFRFAETTFPQSRRRFFKFVHKNKTIKSALFKFKSIKISALLKFKWQLYVRELTLLSKSDKILQCRKLRGQCSASLSCMCSFRLRKKETCRKAVKFEVAEACLLKSRRIQQRPRGYGGKACIS